MTHRLRRRPAAPRVFGVAVKAPQLFSAVASSVSQPAVLDLPRALIEYGTVPTLTRESGSRCKLSTYRRALVDMA